MKINIAWAVASLLKFDMDASPMKEAAGIPRVDRGTWHEAGKSLGC